MVTVKCACGKTSMTFKKLKRGDIATFFCQTKECQALKAGKTPEISEKVEEKAVEESAPEPVDEVTEGKQWEGKVIPAEEKAEEKEGKKRGRKKKER